MRLLIRISLGIVVLFGADDSLAWDYGDARHGSFTLSSSATIEQVYQSVRLASDPPQYDPANPLAIPNFRNFTITNGAKLTTDGSRIVFNVLGVLGLDSGTVISVAGRGFLGGTQAAQSVTGNFPSGEGPGGGGGGLERGNPNGSITRAGAGGGGYGSAGTASSAALLPTNGAGGGVYGTPELTTLDLGSGGGGAPAGRGGNGGGVVAIRAARVRIDGMIDANGEAGVCVRPETLATGLISWSAMS